MMILKKKSIFNNKKKNLNRTQVMRPKLPYRKNRHKKVTK